MNRPGARHRAEIHRLGARAVLVGMAIFLGTAAIVVTISLGYGAEQTQLKALESAVNLRMIQVYPNYGYSDTTTSTTGRRISTINDGTIRQIRAIKGVSAVTPLG